MISRRTFIGMPLLATALSCRRQPAHAAPVWNRASGFASVDVQRMDVLDGYVTLEYEPWESQRYRFTVRLEPARLNEAQRGTIRAGKRYYLGVPQPERPPEIQLDIGPWKFGKRPVVNSDTYMAIHFCRFQNSWGTNFKASATVVRVSKPAEQYFIEVVTKGDRVGHDGRRFSWDLRFSGTCYDDMWMMKPEVAAEDWS